jgi:hypothetical protein
MLRGAVRSSANCAAPNLPPNLLSTSFEGTSEIQRLVIARAVSGHIFSDLGW